MKKERWNLKPGVYTVLVLYNQLIIVDPGRVKLRLLYEKGTTMSTTSTSPLPAKIQKSVHTPKPSRLSHLQHRLGGSSARARLLLLLLLHKRLNGELKVVL